MAGDDFDIEAFLLQEALAAADTANQASQVVQTDPNFPADGLPSFYNLVWPRQTKIVDGWLKQTLGFHQDQQGSVGILQPVNGPCGVLAVIQGVLVANRLKAQKEVDVKAGFSDKEIAEALAEIVCLSASFPSGSSAAVKKSFQSIKGVVWKDRAEIGREVDIIEVEAAGTTKFFLDHIDSYKGEGGLVLLLYSLVATKGEEALKVELRKNGGGVSLVESIGVKDIWFCSSDLMTLLMRGTADGNLGAYNELAKKVELSPGELDNFLDIGMLSLRERQTKIPVLDRLKDPPLPVWVLHSGDHFTTFFQAALDKPNEFYHWNGLPPGGPRLSKITMEYSALSAKASPTLPQTDFVPIPGEIDDIVQANSEDKKKSPKDFTKWRYEVVLAIHDPSVKGPERPKDMKVTLFELGEKPTGTWRCANCYRGRHKTFCFGENKVADGDSETKEACKFCEKTKQEAQWTIWLNYDQLPGGWKRSAQFHYGPKFLTLLTTKWLDAHITEPAIEDFPSV